MEFKDVAHHYIGSKLQTPQGIAQFSAYYDPKSEETSRPIVCYDTVTSDWEIEDVKPILFPLSAMTKEQALEAIKLIWGFPKVDYHGFKKHSAETDNSVGFTCLNEFGEKVGLTIDCHRAPEFSIDGNSLMIPTFKLTSWLLKNHFDLFGLIESEQAIDATTLPVNPYK